jgi:RNA polymerase sigma-70 factor (ECF subfamily)
MDAEIDRRLVHEIAAGSADALGRLYDRHSGIVYGLARRVLARLEDAEEVVQDVFTQVWRDASRYEDARATVAGWLVMLARTRAIDRLRARNARPDQAAAVDPDSAPVAIELGRDPEATAIAAADARKVQAALTVLPDTQRSLVELAFYQGLTHAEIAEQTGVPLGTVKTRLRTAIATLRGALAS